MSPVEPLKTEGEKIPPSLVNFSSLEKKCSLGFPYFFLPKIYIKSKSKCSPELFIIYILKNLNFDKGFIHIKPKKHNSSVVYLRSLIISKKIKSLFFSQEKDEISLIKKKCTSFLPELEGHELLTISF